MAVVEIGTIYEAEGGVALPGWHVDSIAPIDGADAYIVTPENPRHVFSGVGVSYRYKFESKDQAAEFLPVVVNK